MRKGSTIPSSTTAHLVQLIKSMSKAEKRSFKLYSKRAGGSEDALFIKLFDALDRQKEYDEEAIFRKVPEIKRSQLSNLKRNLYRQLLTSLRLIQSSKNIEIEIREQIDFAQVLYSKGLYRQSLKLLQRSKTLAEEHDLTLLILETVEMEKMIESRHISKGMEGRTGLLTAQSEERLTSLSNQVKLTNLSLELYGQYVKTGPIRNPQEAQHIQEFFESRMPALNFETLGFVEKVNYCKCYSLYHYILQNFPQHFRYTKMWVALFENNPIMKQFDPETYLRGMNHLLTALFYAGDVERHETELKNLERFILQNAESFDTNLEVQAFVFLYTARLNKYFLEGTFSKGLFLVPELEEKMARYDAHLDHHRRLVFWYKIACLYFGSGNNDNCILYLNKIINYKAGNLLSDLQCYARILHLIAHYELRHYYLLEYLVKSVYRFLGKMNDLNVVQKEILGFLRKEIRTSPTSLKGAFIKLHAKLQQYQNSPQESRAFLYLDILSWLESKIKGVTVQEIIRAKYLERKAE
ncbi:MAG: hypothetical protein CMN32_15605 [Saprospirales bacterium]|nr:hypothetical protein [Saprospirales bacterium]